MYHIKSTSAHIGKIASTVVAFSLILSIGVYLSSDGARHAFAATTTVNSSAQFATAASTAGPGTIIIIANGSYPGFAGTIAKSGASGNPIIVEPQSAGGVTLTGASRINLLGNYIDIQGMNFSGDTAAAAVYITGNNDAVTGSQFTNSGGASYQGVVTIGGAGTNDEVGSNTFNGGSTSASILMQIPGAGSTSTPPTGTLIDHNTFSGISFSSGAIVAVGLGASVATSLNTLVDSNVFTNDTAAALVGVRASGTTVQNSSGTGDTGSIVIYSGTNNTLTNNNFNGAPPPPPAPTCTFTASPTSITVGSSTLLSWTTTNAATVSINQAIGTVATSSGSQSVSPTATTTYTMTATNSTSSVTCPTTVTVSPVVVPPPPPPVLPSCTLTASSSSITAGASSVLSWITSNADTFFLDGGIGTSTPASGGSVTVSPATTQTYNGTATNSGGNGTCSGTITVTAATSSMPTNALYGSDVYGNANYGGE